MSLTGAMNSAVSAMKAQSTALSIISNNLANISTTGYKASSTNFSSLLTSGSTSSASGGVTATKSQNILASGTLVSSSIATNLAVDGDGFFAVTTGDGNIYYTRNGAFTIDDDTGYLTNNGYLLMGWPTDADGNVVGGTTQSNLEIIDTNNLSGYAAATTKASLTGVLPADAEVGDSYTSELELYDSLGTAYTMGVTWTKTGENTWEMSFSSLTSGNGTVEAAPTDTIEITFNADGTLASPSTATLAISGLSDGSAAMSIALGFGTAGASDGLSQYALDSSNTTVDIACTGNGCAYGTLSGVTIDEDGTVYANYSNGMSLSLYKIPLATFANANGLIEMSNSVYALAGTSSGGATYHFAGSGGAGSIQSYRLEESTTDTNTEFSNMIAAQQAYSAASQVISTAKDMFDALLAAVR
ncbi:FlgE protein [uncultured Pleomorphomonas sp.]|uniref:Flagellar hook protein FlgE n=1 Tax=uncultured Pleomorphomonas sp. TaxID=442121 RepID=A0A212L0H4_9HYPH|nr:flagellar hook protein FlgE [uncultured Pleomorphomonas sp.]SCM71081.1 FlgE protein [uncultured Pleomorphomonas sp.]